MQVLGNWNLRRGWLSVGVAVAALASPAVTLAADPIVFYADVDRTIFAPATSAACGFAVYRHDVGTQKVVLFPDGDGVIVREIDQALGWTTTWFSPETGESFSYIQPSQAHTYYNGNQIGDPALVVVTGLQGATPGAIGAGRVVLPSIVVGISPEGIPDTDQVAPAMLNGTFPSAAELIAARCAALAG